MSSMQVKLEDETSRTTDDEKRAGGAADEVRNIIKYQCIRCRNDAIIKALLQITCELTLLSFLAV